MTLSSAYRGRIRRFWDPGMVRGLRKDGELNASKCPRPWSGRVLGRGKSTRLDQIFALPPDRLCRVLSTYVLGI